MKQRAIIFGAGGQDGFFLREYLLPLGYQVFSYTHHGGLAGSAVDVADFQSIANVIREISPHYIFHLAARSSTRHEFILENHRAIVDGALAILEAADRYAPDARIFFASSGLVFKNVGRPIKESDDYVTNTAYAMARLEALQVARYYRERGRKVFIGFLFNHESPKRPANSIARKIARNVAEIHLGIQKSITIGNAKVVKEWMWAGDAVSAMVYLINQNEMFEVCIGDGIGRSVRDYAVACCEIVGISIDEYFIELSDYQSEYSILISDSAKIRSLGWAPTVGLENLASRMIGAEISFRQDCKV
jgi:GDPmannose 4,6-dehydratase